VLRGLGSDTSWAGYPTDHQRCPRVDRFLSTEEQPRVVTVRFLSFGESNESKIIRMSKKLLSSLGFEESVSFCSK
jgi:hypothetical protein